MKVVFCSSVGGGVFGASQVTAWRASGLDAEMHFGVDQAGYWQGKSSSLSRLRLRFAMFLKYPLMLWETVRQAQAGDVIVAVTNPFFGPALAAKAARKSGVKVIHLVYDLYPEALVFGAGWAPSHPVARFAAATTRSAIRDCDATVYLGDRLRRYSEGAYGTSRCTSVIAVGTDATVFKGCAPIRQERRPLCCLYSGHMGLLHEWRTLSSCLLDGVPEGLRVEIAADGPGANELGSVLTETAKKSGGRLGLGRTRAVSDWRQLMKEADIAVVTMRPGAEKVLMPSKTYSAMAAGQAVLAICPMESDLADTVIKHDCGWVVRPGDSNGLRSLIELLPQRSDQVFAKRCNAFAAAHAHYSMEATAPQWLRLFSSVIGTSLRAGRGSPTAIPPKEEDANQRAV